MDKNIKMDTIDKNNNDNKDKHDNEDKKGRKDKIGFLKNGDMGNGIW